MAEMQIRGARDMNRNNGHVDELELLDAIQIGELFKLRPDWIRRNARGPRQTRSSRRRNLPPPIPSIKIGRYIRFQESAVREWLEGLKRNYPNGVPRTLK
jgi:hypothetical protein